MTGGRGKYDGYNTTEIISMETNESRKGPDLPFGYELSGHAMAKVDENNIYIIGGRYRNSISNGYTYNNKTLIYDQNSFEFTSGPDLNVERAFFGSGIFSSSLHNGRPCLLVAGGKRMKNIVTYPRLSSVEILDFTQPEANWTTSKTNLPLCKRVCFVKIFVF